ncbi:MAG: hypothetical protein OK438_05775 [Thaumarchaeota archaeon]|nr:hypothetical protein [Nitrososphaerota archaeon]
MVRAERNRAKVDTLEAFLLTRGWATAYGIYHSRAREIFFQGATMENISVRLARYHLQGLLARQRVGKWFKYGLTVKGWERLVHLWNKFGCFQELPLMNENQRAIVATRLLVWEIFTTSLARRPHTKSSVFHDLFPQMPLKLPRGVTFLEALVKNIPLPPTPKPPGYHSLGRLLSLLARSKGIVLP